LGEVRRMSQSCIHEGTYQHYALSTNRLGLPEWGSNASGLISWS
jgi:hypothetical protein